MLVLNKSKHRGWQTSVVLDSYGGRKELSCLVKDYKTDGRLSCSVTWKNQFYIFGGATEKRQISRLVAHKLTRIGALSFDFLGGACTQMDSSLIFLCFSAYQGKQCWKSADPMGHFSVISKSKTDHQYTQISASKSKVFRDLACNNIFQRKF